MYEKRGIVLLVVVLFLINSIFVIAPPSAEKPATLVESTDKNFAVRAVVDVGSQAHVVGGTSIGFQPDCSNHNQDNTYEIFGGYASEECGGVIKESSEADVGNCNFPSTLPLNGCWVLMVDPDGTCYDGAGGDDDGCGQAAVKEGTKLGHEYKTFTNDLVGEISEASGSDGSDNWMCGFFDVNEEPDNTAYKNSPDIARYISGDGNDYVCGYTQEWHKCTSVMAAKPVKEFVWGGDDIFICEIENSKPTWVKKGMDKDRDRFVAVENGGLDCADDPELTKQFKDPSTCPTDPTDCSNVDNSECAICINPGMGEICGNRVNNDCGGGSESYTEQNGVTSNSCHANEYACEQKPLPRQSETQDPFPSQNNILDQQFSWISNVNGQGYCCGYSGIESVGEVSDDKEYLCVTHDKEFVGRGSGNTRENFYDDGWPREDRCDVGDWCWISAKLDAKFKVLTINNQKDKPYDVVSNGEEFYKCDANFVSEPYRSLPNPDDGEGEQDDLNKKSNRFACYDANSHYEWVECGGEGIPHSNAATIKARWQGEALFSLPLNNQGTYGEVFEGENLEISSKDSIYKNFYSDKNVNDFLFDFTGYTHLNLFFKFAEEIDAVANLDLEILGPRIPGEDAQIYFKRSIIGDVVNHPFGEETVVEGEELGGYMHVRVELPENLKRVRKINIKSRIPFKARNVFLDKGVFQETPLCSGDQSAQPDESSWIDNVDQGEGRKIDGKLLCEALYGDKAWLGRNSVVDPDSASCCGNGEVVNGQYFKEYYAGDSREIGDEQKKYGCWNSRPIESGETIMNVEYTVEYDDVGSEIDFLDEDLSFSIGASCSIIQRKFTAILDESVGASYFEGWCDGENPRKVKIINHGSANVYFRGPTDHEFQEINSQALNSNYNIYVENGPADYGLEFTCPISISNQRVNEELLVNLGIEKLVKPLVINKPNRCSKGNEVTITINNNNNNNNNNDNDNDNDNDNIKVIFLDKFGNKYDDLMIKLNDINAFSGANLLFSLTDNYKAQINPIILENQIETFTQSCMDGEECLFPLPGNQPYTITNEYPGLYELYFVNGDNLQNQILIPPEGMTFGNEVDDQGELITVTGMLMAKKVAQQVLFLNEDVPGQPRDRGFFGCSAANLVIGEEQVNQENNLQQCQPKGEYTCAYSKTVPGNVPVTSINVWDKQTLPEIMGVNQDAVKQDELVVVENDVAANTLTHSTTIIPARNMLTNAEFCESCFEGNTLNGWEVFVDDLPYRNVQGFFIDSHQPQDDPKVTLASNHLLKSVRIPVINNMQIHYSINSTSSCDDQVRLFNDDGVQISQIALNDGLTFSTLTAAYLTYEISSCKFQQPSLQYVDDKGPVTFGFDEPKTKLRAAVSCCPENHCWDGTHCVEPMGEYTDIGINVGNERYYRCIEGDWTYLPKRGDWKELAAGFCNDESQCFVMSSSKASPENTAETFYQGKFPTCVENGDYIFDNYCDNGEWTTRTSFLAERMIDRTGGDEHSLYCTDFKDVLPTLDGDQLGYLAGVDEGGVGIDEVPTTVCFPAVENDDFANKLITSKENKCINNACILQYNGKTAVATTLNRPIDHENSFTNSLNRKTVDCVGNDDFKDCERGLYHDEVLNSVWFTRDGLDPQQSVIENIFEFFRELLQEETRITQRNLFEEVKNFNQVFSLKKDDKKVLAVQEGFGKKNAILVAEFEEFNTPICEYVNRADREEFKLELLETASGPGVISCVDDGFLQRVEANANTAELLTGLNLLFPEITAKLRVS